MKCFEVTIRNTRERSFASNEVNEQLVVFGDTFMDALMVAEEAVTGLRAKYQERGHKDAENIRVFSICESFPVINGLGIKSDGKELDRWFEERAAAIKSRAE